MTASAKGTTAKPGKKVKQMAGLNRAILDATPGSFLSMLCTKAERNWVRADHLEQPQADAVPDLPLLWDGSEESLGRACASVRLWGRGNAGPGVGASGARGRPEANRSGTDLGLVQASLKPSIKPPSALMPGVHARRSPDLASHIGPQARTC
jgi:hypothetical protein